MLLSDQLSKYRPVFTIPVVRSCIFNVCLEGGASEFVVKFLELQFQFACLLLPFFLSLREDAHHLMSPGSAFSSAARTTHCCSNPTVSERVATKTDPYPTVTLSFMSQTEARLTQPLSLPHAIVVAIVAACCNVDLVNDRQMPTSTAGSQQHSEGGVKSLWSVTPGPPVMLQHLLQ